MSPGKGLWELKSMAEWQRSEKECPLLVNLGTPAGELETKAEQAARAELGEQTRRAPSHLESRRRAMALLEGLTKQASGAEQAEQASRAK
ncbi:hypothetical protein PO909_004538 [Leuciscus waleckii]